MDDTHLSYFSKCTDSIQSKFLYPRLIENAGVLWEKKIIACQYAPVSKNPALWKYIFLIRNVVISLKVQNLIRINKIAIL